jgi:hypothetical protein
MHDCVTRSLRMNAAAGLLTNNLSADLLFYIQGGAMAFPSYLIKMIIVPPAAETGPRAASSGRMDSNIRMPVPESYCIENEAQSGSPRNLLAPVQAMPISFASPRTPRLHYSPVPSAFTPPMRRYNNHCLQTCCPMLSPGRHPSALPHASQNDYSPTLINHALEPSSHVPRTEHTAVPHVRLGQSLLSCRRAESAELTHMKYGPNPKVPREIEGVNVSATG